MHGHLDSLNGLFQRKAMGNQAAHIHVTAEDKTLRFFLQIYGCAVGAKQKFFVHADSGRINRCLAARRLSKKQHAAAGSGGIQSNLNKRIAGDSDNYRVSAAAISDLANALGGILLGSINGFGDAEVARHLKPLGIHIRGKDARSCGKSKFGENHANRPLADHQDGFFRLQAQDLNSLLAGVDRLDKGCLLVTDILWNADNAPTLDDPIHDANIFSKAATTGLVAGSHADFLIYRTLGEDLAVAIKAIAAGDVMKDHQSLTKRITVPPFAHGDNHARCLVSEDARRRVRSGADLLKIGPTNRSEERRVG